MKNLSLSQQKFLKVLGRRKSGFTLYQMHVALGLGMSRVRELASELSKYITSTPGESTGTAGRPQHILTLRKPGDRKAKAPKRRARAKPTKVEETEAVLVAATAAPEAEPECPACETSMAAAEVAEPTPSLESALFPPQ